MGNSSMRLSARYRLPEHQAEPSGLPSAPPTHGAYMPVSDANIGPADRCEDHLVATHHVHLTNAPVLGPILQQPVAYNSSTSKLQPTSTAAEAASSSQADIRHQSGAATDLASASGSALVGVSSQQGAFQLPRSKQDAEVTADAVSSAETAVRGRQDGAQLTDLASLAGNRKDPAIPCLPSLQRPPSSQQAAAIIADHKGAGESLSAKPGLTDGQTALAGTAPAAVKLPSMRSTSPPANAGMVQPGAITSDMQDRCPDQAIGSKGRVVRHAGRSAAAPSKENEPHTVTMARAVPGRSLNPSAALAAAKPSKPVSNSKVSS